MPTSRSNRPRIVVTAGDPSGIGPEVARKALASSKVKGLADFLPIGLAGSRTYRLGKITPASGRASIQYIDRAIELIGDGMADALVTGPVSKRSIRSSGVAGFEGHTEYLAGKTGSRDFAMMFIGKALKITLVTRHIALKDVPGSLSIEKIYKTIALTRRYLNEYFGLAHPLIGVAGLNPHAGEGGLFGGEENDVIIPAIRKASKMMAGISGPVPPDVIFHNALNKKFDAVVAMYHDQALIPFKMLYFMDGVNLTLGLPFIRTSPDHGTAFDIAGRGIADPTSMIEAIRLACRLVKRSKHEIRNNTLNNQ